MNAFQTPEAITVTVEVGAGNVTVVASDRTDTVVDVQPADASKKGDVKAAKQIQVEFAAGNLTVQPPKGWRPLGSSGHVEVTIEVPAGSQLTGTLGVGRLLGAGALGASELEVAAGDIIVESPLGSVTAKVATGNIHIGDATSGVLTLETATGDITVGIHPGSAAVLKSNTPNGSVHNQLSPVSQPENIVEVHAHNASGNITIGNTAAI